MKNDDMSARIADLFAKDLELFLSQELSRRPLTDVVADLNETALSRTNPNSSTARAALSKLGFPD